jgi:amidohydrolase
MSNILELAKENREYMTTLRRYFHQYPEPSLEEYKTAARIREELDRLDIPWSVCAKTGTLGLIKGKGPGKTVALRADMDALNLQELTGLPYCSSVEGMMHGCGHDGHMAMLLGAAKLLKTKISSFNGEIRLLFQPGEEVTNGAKLMIQDGALEGVDGIFGIHLWSGIPAGQVSVEAGPRTAAADRFSIRVTGKGGHGALPHQCIDAVLAASAIVVNLQSLVSREINPNEPVVITVGTIQGGTLFNIVAENALLTGTARTFNHPLRRYIADAVKRITEETARAYRAEAELEYEFGAPPVVNDRACSEIAAKTVTKLLGPSGLIPFDKLCVGEDFAEYSLLVPGVFVLLGSGNPEKNCCYPHHHGSFDIDEASLAIGTALYIQYALDYLG